MKYFVEVNSIVRQIWGKSDTILFIFAGAAAEFALNKAVDWLYFTGKLPKSPLERLFSTVSYARTIVFSEEISAYKSIDAIAAIHANVENKRNAKIPNWAYLDVLFMLIDYSIRSFELLERKLTNEEKGQVFTVLYRVGDRMGIKGLPVTFLSWQKMRNKHLSKNLYYSHFSKDLIKQYRKHLGFIRYRILLETQILILPKKVRNLLCLREFSFLTPLLIIYKISRRLHLDKILRSLILPSSYKKEIGNLDHI
ncbi:oxygenase MpaB family protein [Gillisia marina]|uniref:oxygenase MpaB family protein n=1 Tax=Gillisia marina TaxID=1167637 RepID=UPI00029B5485|nr:oxygenase MpaB family protein [Gillisia marina]